jgi:hypothetical protein
VNRTLSEAAEKPAAYYEISGTMQLEQKRFPWLDGSETIQARWSPEIDLIRLLLG